MTKLLSVTNNDISNKINNEELNCNITKITSNKYEKADFDTEIAKQTHSSKRQQEQLKNYRLSMKSFSAV